MQNFTLMVNNLDSLVWSMVLVGLCLGVGLYLTVRLRFVQFRLLKDMVQQLLSDKGSADGISSFQAFATTVGARVGMGNIAGIASAIYYGGPGAIFWMWVITCIGAASAFTESALGQAFKERTAVGTFIGGPSYYLEKCLGSKRYAIVFAVVAALGPGLLMPGVQVNSLVTVFEEAFGVSRLACGLVTCGLLTFVVCGSIMRIARLAEFLAPFMCLIYIGLALGIIGMHFSELPGVLMLIVNSAMGLDPLLGGILGAAISWGVKRGIYSNEAGMGCGAIVSAAAVCSHPAKQGLIQAFSIYVDSLFVGTATALIILLTGSYNVTDGSMLLIDHVGALESGIKWTQFALVNTYGSWCGKLLAIIIVLFVFTSMTGYCYQAEANVHYLFKNNRLAIHICRAVFVLASFMGCLVEAEAMWAMGDIGYGLLAWANIIAIALLAPTACKLLRDYEEQKAAGLPPVFDPAKCGIEDPTGAWKP